MGCGDCHAPYFMVENGGYAWNNQSVKSADKSKLQGRNSKDNQQKGTILTLLKVDKMNRNFMNRYWFAYKDFLDPTDDFTDFSCERLDGNKIILP